MQRINFIGITHRAYIWVIVLLVIGQGACSLQKPVTEVVPAVKVPPRELPPDPMARIEPRSRYGNPSSYVVFGKRYYPLPSSYNFVERGIASWYGKKFHGKRTSSGETYNMYAMTAAHTRLPLPTYVQVTNLKNNKQIVVRVNDRGPFYDNRIIDLSYAAATKLGIVRKGTALVEVRSLNTLNYRTARRSQPEKTKAQTVSHQAEDPQAHTQMFIQVGAFSARANAKRLAWRLGALNLGAVTISSVIKGAKQLHRVRVGPLSTLQSANEAIVKLYDMGMKGHHMVVE